MQFSFLSLQGFKITSPFAIYSPHEWSCCMGCPITSAHRILRAMSYSFFCGYSKRTPSRLPFNICNLWTFRLWMFKYVYRLFKFHIIWIVWYMTFQKEFWSYLNNLKFLFWVSDWMSQLFSTKRAGINHLRNPVIFYSHYSWDTRCSIWLRDVGQKKVLEERVPLIIIWGTAAAKQDPFAFFTAHLLIK